MALKTSTRGATMMELIIYMCLLAVVMSLAWTLFVVSRSASENTNANYFLSADVDTAVAWLRRDLHQCSLSSIQVYPDVGQSAPGCSFCSTLNPDDTKEIESNDTGHPNWRNHVYYTLQPNQDKVGKLVRWSQGVPTGSSTVSTLAPLLPGAVVQSTSRVIHNRILMPNQQLYGVANPNGKIDEHGGFHVQFVRLTPDGVETLGEDPPAKVSAQKGDAYKYNTKLVQVELKIFTSTNSGKPSFYSLRLRVCPRY